MGVLVCVCVLEICRAYIYNYIYICNYYNIYIHMCTIIYVIYDPMYDSPDFDGQEDVLAIPRDCGAVWIFEFQQMHVIFSLPRMIL